MLKAGICVAAAVGAVAFGGGRAEEARAGGGYSFLQLAPPEGIALAGSAFRWQSFILGRRHAVTVLERVREGDGLAMPVRTLRGRWHLSSPAWDGEGAGVDEAERNVVLTRYGQPSHGILRRRTRLAIVEKRPRDRHSYYRVERATLPGDFTVLGISADGATVFLVHTLSVPKWGGPRFTIVPYDVRSRRLQRATSILGNGEILSGVAAARAQDRGGRHVYLLYSDWRGSARRFHLLDLDTARPTLTGIDLPRLEGWKSPFLLDLGLDRSGSRLLVRREAAGRSLHRARTILRVDLDRLRYPSAEATATASAAAHPVGSAAHPVGTAAHPVGIYQRTVGSSSRGRPIEMLEVGDLSLPGRLLVFGCVHGDECGAERVEPLVGGCPDPDTHAYVVPNLDPDGSARRSRLNARGVDLNRNFGSAWRPLGSPGDPEYAGPRPFSEPETRLAARLIRKLRPRVTVWFHQHRGAGSFVRAWGQSVPAARRFAKLAGLGFRLLRWPAGTAPNWENHRFPGSASFVVELPRGKLPEPLLIRLDRGLGRLGEELEEDPHVARRD